MPTALLTNQRWTTSSPPIYFDLSYESQRSGADMQYRFTLTVKDMGRDPYGTRYYFGYPIQATISLDGTQKDTHQVKAASPSYWSDITYTTGWLTVPGKVTGNVSLSLVLSSSMGSTRSATYTISLPIINAGSMITTMPTIYVGDTVTLGLTRYSPTFRDTITYKFGTLTGTIASGSQATSVSWAVPTSFFLQMVGAAEKQGEITVTTKNGTTTVTEFTYQVTVKAHTVYQLPVISEAVYERGTGSGSAWTADPNGTTLKVSFHLDLTQTGNLANIDVKLNGTSKVSFSGVPGGDFVYYITDVSADSSHALLISATDSYGGAGSISLTVATAEVLLNLNFALNGVGIGKVAEAKGIDIATGYPLKANGRSGALADWVVESGTSGAWNYRKWASGQTEAWYYGTVTSSEDNVFSGTTLHYTEVFTLTTPFAIANAVINGTCSSSGFYIGNTGGSFASQNISFRLFRDGAIAAGEKQIYLSIFGRWA